MVPLWGLVYNALYIGEAAELYVKRVPGVWLKFSGRALSWWLHQEDRSFLPSGPINIHMQLIFFSLPPRPSQHNDARKIGQWLLPHMPNPGSA